MLSKYLVIRAQVFRFPFIFVKMTTFLEEQHIFQKQPMGLMVFEICLTLFLNRVKKNIIFLSDLFSFLNYSLVQTLCKYHIWFENFNKFYRKLEIAQNDNWILIMIWKRGCMYRLLPVCLFVIFCTFYIISSAWILNWSFFLKNPVTFSESLGGFIGSKFFIWSKFNSWILEERKGKGHVRFNIVVTTVNYSI